MIYLDHGATTPVHPVVIEEMMPFLLELDRLGVAVSAGSACTAGTVEVSHVMEALGVPREWAAGSVRFSLGRGNTLEEMDRTVDALPRGLTAGPPSGG